MLNQKAILVLSGDQLGCPPWGLICSGSAVVPSESTTNSGWAPGFAIPRAKAIFEPSGDHASSPNGTLPFA